MARKRLLEPDAAQAMDRFKHEVAQELGLADKVATRGWGDMTTRECGMVGGMMVKKLIKMAEDRLH